MKTVSRVKGPENRQELMQTRLRRERIVQKERYGV